MSDAPEQEVDRPTRRRFGLLWAALFVVMAALVSIGTYAVVQNGSSTPDHSVDAGGIGTAPVLSAPPVDVDPQDTSTPTPHATSTTATGQVPSQEEVARASGGGGALAPDPGASTTTAPTEQPHGINLILTSSLSDTLRPGYERALNVMVRNVNAFPVDLYRVDVRVDDSPKPGCLASWVRAGRYRYDGGTPRRVPASSSVIVTLPIELVDLSSVDQNACQGTYFPLRLSGIAVDPS